MIREDLASRFGEKEKDEAVLAADFDVGFIAGQMGVQRALVCEIEAMAMHGRGLRIVEHGLMRDRDAEKLFEHERGFARAQRKRNVQRENQTDEMRRLMNARELDVRGRGCGMAEQLFVVMMFAILIVQLEL